MQKRRQWRGSGKKHRRISKNWRSISGGVSALKAGGGIGAMAEIKAAWRTNQRLMWRKAASISYDGMASMKTVANNENKSAKASMTA